MTAEELKASVLQMAIEGKLVPQRDDEPAVDIDVEEPDDVPFAIPDKWKWCSLMDVAEVIPSKQYQIQTKNVLENGKYPVVSQSKDLLDGYSDDKSKLLGKDNIPIVVFGDHTKVVKFINFQFIVGAEGTKLLYNKSSINIKYLYYVIKYNVIGMKNGGYSRHFKFLKVRPVPLPSLEEQRRIVERLDEILPVIEQYGKAHDALQVMEKELPGKLRASLLQEAISGRLVPQRDDEPAVDIDVEEPDDIPFAIPDKWKWCKVEDCCCVNPKVTAEDDTEVSFVPMAQLQAGYGSQIDTSCVKKWKEVKKGFTKFCNGDIVLAKITPCFQNRKSAIVVNAYNNIGCGTTEFHVLRCKENIDCHYLLWGLKTSYFINYGVEYFRGTAGQQRLGTEDLKKCLIPLPPLAEQRRIVEKLNELLPSVEAMEKLYQQ